MRLDGGRRDVEVIGDLLVGLPGVDQAQHLPFAPGQRRTADQLGHVGAVDDVLDHRLVQRDANGAAEIALLLRQLDQARGALGLGFIKGALVQQALEHADDRLADAQEAADGATAAGQGHGPLQVVQCLLALLAQPVQLRQEDMVAVAVHDQAVALGIGQQLAQDRQGALQLPQRQVGTGVIARIELGEMVGATAHRRRTEQPLADRLAILAGVPVGEHDRVGIGQPVDVVAVVGEHRLQLRDVVGTGVLLAAGVGDAGQQRVTLQAPAWVVQFVEYLDTLQRALLGSVQLVPFQQHLAAHPVDELDDGRGLQILLLDVLDGALLQGIGLLQMPLSDGDFRQLPETPDHQVRGIDLPRAALGFLVLFLRLGKFALDEMRLGQARHRRYP